MLNLDALLLLSEARQRQKASLELLSVELRFQVLKMEICYYLKS
jgi:hypothetical protein